VKSIRVPSLVALAGALLLVAWAVRVEAYPYYDDGAGNGCVSCHNGYQVSGGMQLHIDHLTKFNITNCTVCHQTAAGGDKPVLTYWSPAGFSCSGCHGVDYGQTTSSSLSLPNLGNPESTAYGLRAKHALEFAAASQPNVCATCHYPGSAITGEPDPAPAIKPETTRPPYYEQPSLDNLTDPCSSEQESFESVFPGLDNDGNGFADMTDSACAAFIPTTTTTSPTTSTTTTTIGGTARRITVYPGQSIQDAVNAIAPGGTIYVMPGTYQEQHLGDNAVTVSKSGVRLIARSKPKDGSRVILKPWGNQRHGIVVQGAVDDRIDGFKLKGFTVQGFPNNGILTRYLDNFRIERNESVDNLENGIWPTLSANGLVKKNVAYGSEDSALWVEASENVRVFNNELYDSPTGLEITVSNKVVAKKNDVHDNTTGIGLYNYRGAGLPPLQPPELNGDWEIAKNHVHDNNKVNTVTGGLVELLPPGGGILVIGVDNVNVTANQVENNDFYGIAVVDWCLAVGCPEPGPIPPALDGAPDNNTFVRNDLVHNGTNPQPGSNPLLQVFAAFAGDITYVVPGSHSNCFAGNVFTPPIKGLGTPTEAKSCN
jgi:parallel beta helix pectate lyase-like protein